MRCGVLLGHRLKGSRIEEEVMDLMICVAMNNSIMMAGPNDEV